MINFKIEMLNKIIDNTIDRESEVIIYSLIDIIKEGLLDCLMKELQ